MDDQVQTGLKAMKDDDIRTLYETYGEWARHYHNLVWATAAFGVTVATSGIVLFHDVAAPAFSMLGAAILGILYLSHQLAEGNRRQWADCKEVQNKIEAHWRVRNSDNNPRGALFSLPKAGRTWRVQPARHALYWAIATMTVVAVVAKWFGLLDGPLPACK